MKKISAFLLALMAGTSAVSAGGISEPIGDEQPAVAVAPTSSSSSGVVVLLLLLLAGAAIAGGGSDGTDETEE